MTNNYIRKIIINNCEYFLSLESIDVDQFIMYVKHQNILYKFNYNENLKNIICIQCDTNESVIDDIKFINYHLTNYLKILDNEKFSIFEDFNEIEYKGDKLIILDNNEMFFYDSQNFALFSIVNYKISKLEMIYLDNVLNKINFSNAQKRFNKLIKNNYEILEIKLIGNEIHKLNTALNKENNPENSEEILFQLRDILVEFNQKSQLLISSNNQYYVKKKILNESRYFQIVFNNLFLLFFAKNMISLTKIFGELFIEKQGLIFLFLYRFSYAFILPIAELILGAIELLSINFYFERKIEIDQLKDDIEIECIIFEDLISDCLNNSKNIFTKLFGLLINNFFKYTFDLFLYFCRQIIKIFFQPIFAFKNYFYNKFAI